MNDNESVLFVAGIADSISEEILKGMFEAAGGEVRKVVLPKDRLTGNSRGFGFVTLANATNAATAQQALHGSRHGGKMLTVRPFQENPNRPAEGGPSHRPTQRDEGTRGHGSQAHERTLYLGNLPFDTNEKELRTVLQEAGCPPVQSLHLPLSPEGKMRGFAFVAFPTQEDAHQAMLSLRAVSVRDRALTVKFSQPKTDRSAPSADSSRGSAGSSSNRYSNPQGGAGFSSLRPAALPRAERDKRRKPSYGEEDYGPKFKRARAHVPSLHDWQEEE